MENNMRLDEIDNIVRATVRRHYFGEHTFKERDIIRMVLSGYLKGREVSVKNHDNNLIVEVDSRYTWACTREGVSFDQI